jgi:hypothetical protein
MKKMEVYDRFILALILIASISSIIYFLVIIMGITAPEFPYGIFLPGYAIILIPIIAHRKLKKKENKSL